MQFKKQKYTTTRMRFWCLLGVMLLLMRCTENIAINEEKPPNIATTEENSITPRVTNEANHKIADFNIQAAIEKLYPHRQIELRGSDTLDVNFFHTEFYSRNLHPTEEEGSDFYSFDLFWHLEEDNQFQPLWYIQDNSDFPPHTFAYLDFNGDAKKDLLVLGGFEDVSYSKIFLQKRLATFDQDNFQRAYINHNEYISLFDFEGDGEPSILEIVYPENYDKEKELDRQMNYFGLDYVEDFPLNDPIKATMRAEYARLAIVQGSKNFTYNLPEAYPIWNLRIESPIRILQFEGDEVVDVTTDFPEHLEWRLAILAQIQAEYVRLNNKENPKIQELTHYFNHLLSTCYD